MADWAQFSSLVHQTYAAADGSGSWDDLLATLMRVSNSRNVALLRFDVHAGTAGNIVGIEPAPMRLYLDHYSKINPWTTMAVSDLSIYNGPVAPSEAMLSLSQFKRTEFYNDWGRQNDVVHSLCGSLGIDQRHFAYLSLSRGERHGPMQEPETSLLTHLLPHLRTALAIHDNIARLKALAYPKQLQFLLDATGAVLDMTPAADRWIARKDILQIGKNRAITTTSSKYRNHLSRLLHQAQPQITRIHNSKGHEYVLFSRPIPGTHHVFASHHDWRILTVIPPESKSQLAQIGAIYSLTPAEIRLCQTLLDTGSLDRAMQVLSITRNTVRAQMSAIFRKTNTTRQGELIRLLTRISSIAHMCDDE